MWGAEFIYYGIRHADRDLLLISPRVALQITVERLISTIEVLNLIEFFEKTDSYRPLLPHDPNEGVGGFGRPPGSKFREALQFLSFQRISTCGGVPPPIFSRSQGETGNARR